VISRASARTSVNSVISPRLNWRPNDLNPAAVPADHATIPNSGPMCARGRRCRRGLPWPTPGVDQAYSARLHPSILANSMRLRLLIQATAPTVRRAAGTATIPRTQPRYLYHPKRATLHPTPRTNVAFCGGDNRQGGDRHGGLLRLETSRPWLVAAGPHNTC
jgi:hypothetical protein